MINLSFDNLRIAYNYLYKKAYDTECDMWNYLYKKHKSIKTLDKMFGIGEDIISNRLKYFGIILFNNNDKKSFTESLFYAIPLDIIRSTSQKELADMVGCSRMHISRMLRTHNIEGIKLLSGRPKGELSRNLLHKL